MKELKCGYQIDPDFNIISKRGLPLSLIKRKDGYFNINLHIQGKKVMVLYHRLVAEGYVPNPNNLPVVNHKDGNKGNNHPSNLEWCTQQYNSQHALDNGLTTRASGTKHYSCKLSQEDVQTMRSMRDSGYKLVELAKVFDVTATTVSNICRGKTHASTRLEAGR